MERESERERETEGMGESEGEINREKGERGGKRYIGRNSEIEKE